METCPQCAICGTTQQLLRCAKCKAVFYCSTAHQHMDWPKHKQKCRLLSKQRNNNIHHLHQSFPVTTHTNENISVDLIGGYESAVGPTIRMAPPPANTVDNESTRFFNHAVIKRTDIESQIHVSETDATITAKNVLAKVALDTNSYLLPQYHHVDQRLLSPQYRQKQQLLMQQQLERQQIPTPDAPHSKVSSVSSHNGHHHYEKSFSCQVGSGGGMDENAFGNANERRYDELCQNIINDMNQYGLSVVDDFLGVEKGLQILNEVHRMYAAGVFKDGQLVNNLREEQVHTIRGDKITWVKGEEPGCASVGYLINQIDAVICRANTMKNNGQLGNYNIKERTKAMVACYPGSGSHYVVHVDNPNKDGRVITAIYYLNVNWDTERSGGVLRIFPEHGNSVADIEPKFDRLIFFWSDRRNPHEVQPSHRTRYAITVWYFDANEREAALNRIKNNENNTKVTPSTTPTDKNITRRTPDANIQDISKNMTNPHSDAMNESANATVLKTPQLKNSLTVANSNAIVNRINFPSTQNSTENINTHNSNIMIVNSNSSEICT